MPEVTIKGQQVTVQEFSGRRALRTARILKSISQKAPEVFEAMTAFVETYRTNHVMELDRARARFEFPAETTGMTDADWEATGGVLRIPRMPSPIEVAAHVFPIALDMAEEQVLMLLALGPMTNEDLAKLKREGGYEAVDVELKDRGEELLDADVDELIELAAVMGELVKTQFADKVQEARERLDPLLRLVMPRRKEEETSAEPETSSAEDTAWVEPVLEAVGSSPESTPSTTPRDGSSSDSPEPSAGPQEPPSTSTPSSSSGISTPA